jgi:pantetheine-phosphate adenylyltransferase
MKFKKVVVGGTFEYLHDGHKAILSKAFEVGDRVLVGITSDQMQLRKDSTGVPPLKDRRAVLEKWLTSTGLKKGAEVVVISDPFGPALDDSELEAIIVSPETRKRAKELNQLRVSRGLNKLKIIEIPFVLAEDGLPISSLRIKYGEIDVHGRRASAAEKT